MKAKKIIIALIAILAVFGGTFAGLWFFTDVFNFLKPAEDVFSNQIEKAFNLEEVKFANYSDFLKDYKNLSEKSSKTNLNMSANLKISKLDSNVQNTINKSTIKLESNMDVKNNKSQNKLGLYSNNSEVLTLDVVSNNNKMGIACKDLYDKYITVSTDDIIKILKEQSSSADIAQIESALNSLSSTKINPYDLLYISDEDLKHFDDTYRDCLNTLISKDCYTSEKNVSVKVDGEKIETTAYYLTLTGKDAYDFMSKLTDLISDDGVLAKVLTEKINLLLSSTDKKISEDDIKEALTEATKSLMEELESIKDESSSAIQIAVYSNKLSPVRIDINTIEDVEKADEKETVLSIEYAKNKTLYTIYADEKELTITDEYSKNSKEERVGTMTLSMAGSKLGTLEYEFVNKTSETKMKMDLSIPLADVSAKFDISSKGDYNKEPVSVEGVIGFSYGRESAEIKFDGSVEYTDNVTIPELSSSNSVDILNKSENEQKELLLEILTKASQVLPARLKLIGIDINSSDILPTMPTTVEPSTELDVNTIQENIDNAQSNIDAIKENMENMQNLLP